ncbi:hypothetical protein [Shewanella algae]|uniref:hypothetical protein n=1 Tax=Shewanella algae TaxID=38313 RepID=UPI00399A3C5C
MMMRSSLTKGSSLSHTAYLSAAVAAATELTNKNQQLTLFKSSYPKANNSASQPKGLKLLILLSIKTPEQRKGYLR